MQAVVLAAGKGTRMRSSLPKVLHQALGAPLIWHVLETLGALGVRKPYVVIGSGAELVRKYLMSAALSSGSRPEFFLQRLQRGTGHAVMMAENSLKNYRGDVLIWPGDMPALRKETLRRFFQEHRRAGSTASVLSCLQINPTGYGRILRSGGRFYAIREELDASDEERRIQEVNTGVYLFKAQKLLKALKQIRPENRKRELYLTDVIEILSGQDEGVTAFPFADTNEGYGVNDRKDLSKVTQLLQQKEIQSHMEKGVTFVMPETTYVAKRVKIGQDTIIHPSTYIESGVVIGKNCQIGPFAKIRSGSSIGDGSIIGSFVEINRSKIGKKVSAKHLAYLGDATVSDESNIGAGTITANFDGKKKHATRIGKKCLIGSNTVLIAPLSLADGVKTGAGAVVKSGSRFKRGQVVVGVPARAVTKKHSG